MSNWIDGFTAGLHTSITVLGTGLLEHNGTNHPAVLTRSLYGQEWVWAPTGRKGVPESHIPTSKFNAGWVKFGDRVICLED